MTPLMAVRLAWIVNAAQATTSHSNLRHVRGSPAVGSDRSIDDEGPGCRFLHGVASGDPLPGAVMIWTRATPINEGASAQPVNVHWAVWPSEAKAAAPAAAVARGEALAGADRDFTVKVDVSSGLLPGVNYSYQFSCGRATSLIGRFRLPPPRSERLEELRYAVFSCANWVWGYFTPYGAAAREPLDFWLHVGDFIYEYGRLDAGSSLSKHKSVVRNTVEPKHEIVTLDDYRKRYAIYRTDANLQELSAAAPLIAIWDDHEVANDAWLHGAQNHNPAEGLYSERKAVAMQAYHEWLPTRETDFSPRWDRRYEFGDLASMVMLDTRLTARTSSRNMTRDMVSSKIQQILQTENNFNPGHWPGSTVEKELQQVRREVDMERSSEKKMVLGPDQLAWVKQGAARASEDGIPWFLVSQTLAMQRNMPADYLGVASGSKAWENALAEALDKDDMMCVNVAAGRYGIVTDFDSWPGYAVDREKFVEALDAARDSNVVVYGGDSHNAWAGHLRAANGKLVGHSFDGMSVTSLGLEFVQPLVPPSLELAAMQATNPDLVWADVSHRGFMLVHLTHDAHKIQYIAVDTQTSQTASPRCLQAFEVLRGNTTLRPARCGPDRTV